MFKTFGDVAIQLAKNPLGIIALFIVLVYGIASIMFGVSSSSLNTFQKDLVVLFMILFPSLVLGVFAWLVAFHHLKLYAPGDYRDDKSFLLSQTPLEQKLALESQVSLLANASKVDQKDGSVPTGLVAVDTANSTQTVHRYAEAISLAEDLAIREMENEFGVSANRKVKTGVAAGKADVPFDGAFTSGNQVYFIEVRYLPKLKMLSQGSVDRILTKCKPLINQGNSIIIAFVFDQEPSEPDKILFISDVARVPSKVSLRFLGLEQLKVKYGIAS